MDYLFFWGHKPRPDGKLGPSCLSQWWPCDFIVDGIRYSTAEKFMMAEKARLFGDDAMLNAILAADEPGRIKAFGRQVQGFDDDVWADARFDIVVTGSEAKFGQDDALRFFLLGTRHKVLVEASPRDRIWGIGMGAKDPRAGVPVSWNGSNLLGFALMEARARIRASG